MRKINIENKKFGRLKVLREVDPHVTSGGNKLRAVEAVCDCGTIKTYTLSKLTSGRTQSCGCYHKEKINSPRIEHIKNGKLHCRQCNSYKDPDDFHSLNSGHGYEHAKKYRLGKRSICKECHYENMKKRLRDSTVEIYMRELAKGIKSRSKRKFKISSDDLVIIWHKQNGKCALSGVDMTHKCLSGRIPTNASVDRIKHGEDYSIDNIRLVCSAVNMMRSDMPDNELIEWCERILTWHKINKAQ